jgi:ABC-type lipoprotein release transport system permease subunit
LLNRPGDLAATTHALRRSLDSTREVMPWQVMNKSLVQEIQGDNAGGIIMLGILYVVVAFGVFGTILMMTMERKKEFAVMIAVGMHRVKLTWIILLETFFIGLLGILVGAALVLPAVLYLHQHPIALTGSTAESYQQFGIEPIMPASLDPGIFLYQGLTVLAIAIVSAIYPLWYINRFRIAEILKQ